MLIVHAGFNYARANIYRDSDYADTRKAEQEKLNAWKREGVLYDPLNFLAPPEHKIERPSVAQD